MSDVLRWGYDSCMQICIQGPHCSSMWTLGEKNYSWHLYPWGVATSCLLFIGSKATFLHHGSWFPVGYALSHFFHKCLCVLKKKVKRERGRELPALIHSLKGCSRWHWARPKQGVQSLTWFSLWMTGAQAFGAIFCCISGNAANFTFAGKEIWASSMWTNDPMGGGIASGCLAHSSIMPDCCCTSLKS